MPDACGEYTDGCRAAYPVPTGHNVLRALTLYGTRYGEFIMDESLYGAADTACAGTADLIGAVHAVGTFAIRGNSTCNGLCAVSTSVWLLIAQNSSAELIEMSLAHTTITAYHFVYISYLQVSCVYCLLTPRHIARVAMPMHGRRMWRARWPTAPPGRATSSCTACSRARARPCTGP